MGIGIRPKFLPHVFDRFRQGDPGAARRYGGLAIQCSLPSSPSSDSGMGSTQGLNTGTRTFKYSDVSRETIVKPCCCAVTAMIRSGWERVCPDLRPSSTIIPLEHYVLGYRKNPLVEHRANLVHKPIIQLRPACRIGKPLDSKPDLRERDDAYVQ